MLIGIAQLGGARTVMEPAEAIQILMQATDGNENAAAKLAGISQPTFHRYRSGQIPNVGLKNARLLSDAAQRALDRVQSTPSAAGAPYARVLDDSAELCAEPGIVYVGDDLEREQALLQELSRIVSELQEIVSRRRPT